MTDFIDNNNVSQTLTDALIDDLGLKTDAQKVADQIEELTGKIRIMTFWMGEFAKDPTKTDEEKLAAKTWYEAQIAELTRAKNVLEQGCDPYLVAQGNGSCT
ncbi:hypothetical protein [Falsiruegeria mediterranea]